jgi:hypothetical protein
MLFGNDYKMTRSGYRQKGQTRIKTTEWKLDKILCIFCVKRKRGLKVKVTSVLQIQSKVQSNGGKNSVPLGYHNDAYTAGTLTPNIKKT